MWQWLLKALIHELDKLSDAQEMPILYAALLDAAGELAVSPYLLQKLVLRWWQYPDYYFNWIRQRWLLLPEDSDLFRITIDELDALTVSFNRFESPRFLTPLFPLFSLQEMTEDRFTAAVARWMQGMTEPTKWNILLPLEADCEVWMLSYLARTMYIAYLIETLGRVGYCAKVA